MGSATTLPLPNLCKRRPVSQGRSIELGDCADGQVIVLVVVVDNHSVGANIVARESRRPQASIAVTFLVAITTCFLEPVLDAFGSNIDAPFLSGLDHQPYCRLFERW